MNKSNSFVSVWHEYGSPIHYRALDFFCRDHGGVRYFEFRFIRQFFKGVLRRDCGLCFRSIRNGYTLVRNLITGSPGSKFVVGAAPYDWRVALIIISIRNGDLYWHNSWPVWDGSRTVKDSWLGYLIWRKLFLPRVKKAFFVTNYAKNAYLESRLPKMPISVVAHSFENNIFNTKLRSSIFDGNAIKIIYVGRLVESKGIFDVIETVKILKEKLNIKVDLVFVGDGADKNRLQSLCQNNGINALIKGVLGRNDLAVELSSSNFLLLPSKRINGWEEAFGMVVIEAMACGCIPLCTDHAGPLEILKSNFPALIFPEDKFIGCAAEYIKNISSDRSKITHLSMQAASFANIYSVQEVAKRWDQIFYDFKQ